MIFQIMNVDGVWVVADAKFEMITYSDKEKFPIHYDDIYNSTLNCRNYLIQT